MINLLNSHFYLVTAYYEKIPIKHTLIYLKNKKKIRYKGDTN